MWPFGASLAVAERVRISGLFAPPSRVGSENRENPHIQDTFVWTALLPWFRYTTAMPHVTLDLPEKLSRFLAASGDVERAALEAIALQAYREEKLSTGELRRLLGYRTRLQVHAFLKAHGVPLQYGLDDLEHDRQEGDMISQPPAA